MCGPWLSSALSSIILCFCSGNEGNELRDVAANGIITRTTASTVQQWPAKTALLLLEHFRNITIGGMKGRVSNFDYVLALNCLSGRSVNDLCQYVSRMSSGAVQLPVKWNSDLNNVSNYRDSTTPMGAPESWSTSRIHRDNSDIWRSSDSSIYVRYV